MAASAVQIGGRRIADDAGVYVIAEAGVNHNGCVERALAMVDVAAGAGADAVKFQIFSASTLVTAAAPKADYQQGSHGRTQFEMLRALELRDADWRRLSDRARHCGVDFLATPFSTEDAARLEGLAAPAIKLSSADLNNAELLGCCAATGLPLIVSTGAATSDEIAHAVDWLAQQGAGDRLVLLHCVSAYPTPLAAANLRAIATLSQRFDVPAGYSDHTESLATGAWAVMAGACVIEKHFTLDRRLPGPDQSFSLEPDALGRYITQVRNAQAARGTGCLDAQEIEVDVRRVARRSLVARRNIAADTPLTPDLVTAKRPAGGIPPEELSQVVGRTLACAVAADEVLQWDMLR